MNLKIPISNRGYLRVLEEIGNILDILMINKEVEEIFNHYCENVVNSDEAAAILTLAEILKCNKEGLSLIKADNGTVEGSKN